VGKENSGGRFHQNEGIRTRKRESSRQHGAKKPRVGRVQSLGRSTNKRAPDKLGGSLVASVGKDSDGAAI